MGKAKATKKVKKDDVLESDIDLVISDSKKNSASGYYIRIL